MDATTFAALGEPSRLRIVELLRVGPSSVGEIAEKLGIRQPQISRHLGVLRKAGVVDVEPVARRHIYHLRGERFDEIGDWLDSFEELWDARLESLETFLRAAGEPTEAEGRGGEHAFSSLASGRGGTGQHGVHRRRG